MNDHDELSTPVPPVKRKSIIRRYKESDAWLWTEVAAVIVGLAFLIPTAIALWIDLEDRQTQRIAQAWELVTRPAPGNAGKAPALEYLKGLGIELVGVDLSKNMICRELISSGPTCRRLISVVPI